MKLFYTTSAGYDEPQKKPTNSLGGFKSSSEVLNDDFGNLFDEISLMTLKTNRDQYIGLILQNDAPVDVQNVLCWFETNEDDICQLELAVATTVIDPKSGDPRFERISTMYNRPTIGQFVAPVETALADLGTMTAGQEYGIWIKRTLLIDKALAEYNNVREKDLTTQTRWKKIEKNKQEKIKFVISWGDPRYPSAFDLTFDPTFDTFK